MLKGLTQFLNRPRHTLKKLFQGDPPQPQLQIIPRDQHPVSRKLISDNALKVLYRLHNAGFDAFLVGGGVRDILLNQRPKDFDVATNARPEEVKALFRNSRLIGRRFRIVHVQFGREIIEVTTFRGNPPAQQGDSPHALQSEDGLLLRDNVYGTIEEDAMRRDFTVNALYYNIADYAVHDYANGMADIQQRLLRMIGDAATRYREDPVRMLRAVRFAVKLDFRIAPDTAAPISELAPLLRNIPPARLFEEVLKLFLSGQAAPTFELLREYRLFGHLFPATEHCLQHDAHALELVRQALANTDQRIREDKPVTPAFLYAALLWPALQQRSQELHDQGMPIVPAQQQAAHEVINAQLKHTAIPRRFSIPMREIWDMQQRLQRRHGQRANQLLEHPRFRAAYDFILLREQAGEQLHGLGQWWTDYQAADETERQRMIKQLDGHKRKPRKRRRPRKRSASREH